MARASKRTTVLLTAVAVVFVVVVIILCIIPSPCRPGDPCHQEWESARRGGQPKDTVIVDPSTTSTTPSPILSTKKTTTSTTTPSMTSSTTSSTTPSNTPVPIPSSTSSTTPSPTSSTSSTTPSSTPSSTSSTTQSSMSSTTPSSTSSTSSTTQSSTPSTASDTEDTASTLADAETTPVTMAETEDPPSTPFDSTDPGDTTSDEETATPMTTMEETPQVSTSTPQVSTTTPQVSTTTPMATTTEPAFILKRGTTECSTTNCKRLAARMLDLMDLGDVDPCEDFYQYACGGVEDDHFLKPENPQHFSDAILTDYLQSMSVNDTEAGDVKKFYDGCLNYTTSLNETERLEKARDAFSELGLEFIPNASPSAVDFDMTATLAKMMAMHFTPFFDLTLDVDGEDLSSFVLRLTPTLFTSPFTDDLASSVCIDEYYRKSAAAKTAQRDIDLDESYMEYTDCKREGLGMKARVQKMKEAVKQMNLVGYITDPADRTMVEDGAIIDTNFLLNDTLSLLPSTPEFRKKMLNKDYMVMTITELDIQLPGEIAWSRLVDSVLGHSVDPTTTRVQVYFKDELAAIVDYLSEEFYNGQNLQNMFLTLWSERVYSDIVRPFGSGLSTKDYCLRVTKNLMHDYSSYIYMKALDAQGELDHRMEQIRKIIRINKLAAQEQLETHSEADVTQLLEKLVEMKGEVANITVARDSLLPNMNNVTITGDFSEDAMTLLRRYRRLLYNNLHLTPNTPAVLWNQFLLPFSSYGTTVYPLNVFMIPYGALEPPLYYGDDVPMYVNYAGIGHMVAHELMHGFDGTGNQYDGSMKSHMNDASFLVRPSECLSEQLEINHSVTSRHNVNTTFTLHPKLALNEFIADSAATRLALMAYWKYTVDKDTTPAPTVPATGGRGNDTHRRRRSLAENAGGRARRKAPPPTLEEINFVEQPLPYLDHTPLQLFFLRMAQTHCSPTSDIMLTVKEDEHLTPYQRVNMVLQNEPYFRQAFGCKADSRMIAQPETCSYSLTKP